MAHVDCGLKRSQECALGASSSHCWSLNLSDPWRKASKAASRDVQYQDIGEKNKPLSYRLAIHHHLKQTKYIMKPSNRLASFGVNIDVPTSSNITGPLQLPSSSQQPVGCGMWRVAFFCKQSLENIVFCSRSLQFFVHFIQLALLMRKVLRSNLAKPICSAAPIKTSQVVSYSRCKMWSFTKPFMNHCSSSMFFQVPSCTACCHSERLS